MVDADSAVSNDDCWPICKGLIWQNYQNQMKWINKEGRLRRVLPYKSMSFDFL